MQKGLAVLDPKGDAEAVVQQAGAARTSQELFHAREQRAARCAHHLPAILAPIHLVASPAVEGVAAIAHPYLVSRDWPGTRGTSGIPRICTSRTRRIAPARR